ncbi:MAG: crossover junction endodeoxyribonuclease RuvC [Patescibacteria group bacterium]|jgi:crossover junction endodeoxyribonuclease RuvC|nr:crossover junction endodeoxyribonuclease RuvC [Patescibacteria group bacterium]
MRILGIDPGTAIVGFGVIDVDGQEKTMIDAGVIRTPANQELELRLETIYIEINEIIKANKPELMVIEQLFFGRNVTTAISVSHARGVIVLAGQQAGLKIEEFTPPQIKQALTGTGSADKKQVQEMVKLLLNLKEVPQPDDCADALAAALTFNS